MPSSQLQVVLSAINLNLLQSDNGVLDEALELLESCIYSNINLEIQTVLQYDTFTHVCT